MFHQLSPVIFISYLNNCDILSGCVEVVPTHTYACHIYLLALTKR